jgi:deoxyadenosine/deoxycytidine kinase
MAPIIVSIDGNIGSGKSKTLEEYKKYIESRGGDASTKKIVFIQEPVNDWMTIKDAAGTNILENLYKDTKKYAFRFQMMAYISRLALLRRAVRDSGADVIITERSVNTDRNVFAKMLYDVGDIEHDEYVIYNNWFNEFTTDVPVDGVVYVRASPDTCIDRIAIRARPGETIQRDYIERCHQYHEDWIVGGGGDSNSVNQADTSAKLYLEANQDVMNNPELLQNRFTQIDEFISELLENKKQH